VCLLRIWGLAPQGGQIADHHTCWPTSSLRGATPLLLSNGTLLYF